MTKLTLQLTIALLTFITGIALSAAWFFDPHFVSNQPRLSIPDASWEQPFFKDINAVTRSTGLADLRRIAHPQGDLEARI